MGEKRSISKRGLLVRSFLLPLLLEFNAANIGASQHSTEGKNGSTHFPSLSCGIDGLNKITVTNTLSIEQIEIVSQSPTFEALTLAVHVWGLDSGVLQLSGTLYAFARSLPTCAT